MPPVRAAAAPVPIRWGWLDWPAGVRLAAATGYAAFVTWALLAPGSTFEGVDGAFPHQDKVAHGVIFLALALVVRWGLPGALAGGRGRTMALAALVGYAAAMEFLQAAIPAAQRTFEWADLALNQAGLWAGWVLLAPVVLRPAQARAPGDGERAAAGTTTGGRVER